MSGTAVIKPVSNQLRYITFGIPFTGKRIVCDNLRQINIKSGNEFYSVQEYNRIQKYTLEDFKKATNITNRNIIKIKSTTDTDTDTYNEIPTEEKKLAFFFV